MYRPLSTVHCSLFCMLLTVAINSYKNPEMLKLCLLSVRKAIGGMATEEVEVLVADGETGEDTQMMMREEFPEVRFFPTKENIGFGGLVNRCLDEAKGDFIFLLNYDISLGETTIAEILNFMKDRPDVGMVGPELRNFDGTAQISAFRFYHPMTIVCRRTPLGRTKWGKQHLDWFVYKDKDLKETQEVDWIMGSALMVRRTAQEKVGGMDRRFFMYMEDVDWCRRFWEQKYKVIYYPKTYAYHYHGKVSARGGFLTSLLFNKFTWVHISSAIKYFWKYRKRAHKCASS